MEPFEGDECLLTSLPDTVLANNLWPPDRIAEGMCVGSKSLTQALLTAPGVHLEGLGVADAQAFAGTLKLMTCLQELHLSDSQLGRAGAEALAGALKLMTCLRELHLSDSQLGRGGAEALAGALEFLTGLKTLVLQRSSIGWEEVSALAPSLPPHLLLLDLGGNLLGEQGVPELMPNLPTTIQHLILEGSVGPDGAVAVGGWLQRLTALQTLDLSHNGLTNDTAAELRARLGGGYGEVLRVLALRV